MLKAPFPTFTKYEILGVLGHGSMGTVYKARHTLGRMVALKVPRPELIGNSTSAERFLREGHALAMLEHPHIVRVYDADEENGLPYITMEYVEGGTLGDHIRESKRLTFSKAQQWTLQIAGALDYIHGRGILHRDLKSSNVLITSDGQARITDFGIAHVDLHATLTNGILGTPAYMSPEQARGAALDHRSDLYSLGVILYEALTGQIPFMEENGLALIQQIIHDPPPPVTSYRPDTPPWLARIVHQCLQKDPAKRYQSGRVLAQALQEGKRFKSGIHSVKGIAGKERLYEYFDDTKAWLRRSRQKVQPAIQSPRIIMIAGAIFVLLLWLFSISFSAPDQRSPREEAQGNRAGIDSTAVDTTTRQRDQPTWQPWPAN